MTERDRAVRAMLGWREAPPARARLSLVALIVVFVLSACSGREQAVVLWHGYNGTERAALEETARAWNAEHPERPLELVAVPYASFGDKLTSAIPGGNGPDLFIYPQDRIGDWADAHIIEPLEFWVDDARADRFSAASLEAMAYEGSLWGLPVAVKSLVLFYRTDLVAEPPRTTDELVALGKELRATSTYALVYANADLYGHAPWLHGFGGRIFDGGALAIATPEAAPSAELARELVTQKLAPPDGKGPQVASLFNAGRAAMAISGPWFLSEIDAHVPWKIAVLPTVSATGRPAAPFLGAEGIVMSARARDKAAAFAVLDYLTSDASALVRAKTARQVVPNVLVYDDAAVARDEVLSAFRAQIPHTVPMPNGPRMRPVWTPYQTALDDILSGRAKAFARLSAVESEIAGYLGRN